MVGIRCSLVVWESRQGAGVWVLQGGGVGTGCQDVVWLGGGLSANQSGEVTIYSCTRATNSAKRPKKEKSYFFLAFKGRTTSFYEPRCCQVKPISNK